MFIWGSSIARIGFFRFIDSILARKNRPDRPKRPEIYDWVGLGGLDVKNQMKLSLELSQPQPTGKE